MMYDSYLYDTGAPIYIWDLQYNIGGVLYDIGAPIFCFFVSFLEHMKCVTSLR